MEELYLILAYPIIINIFYLLNLHCGFTVPFLGKFNVNQNKREETKMSNYFLFGKYENGGAKNASADRTNLCKEITTKYGGKFNSCWALLGDWDIV